jgi:Escherichia/Staphylococcus phage prohead protease
MSNLADGFERRFVSGGAIVDLAEGRRIKGYAVVFNVLSEDLDGFREMIAPEAVDRTLRTNADIRALWNHNDDQVLGRTRAGTLALAKKSKGLWFDINPPNWAEPHLETIARGDVSGVSFAFRVKPGGQEWDKTTSPPTRVITDMEMSEISPCTFPAYAQTDVQVAQRSLRAMQAEHQHNWRQQLHEINVIRYGR